MHLNELEIANKIKDGDLPSPFKWSNMWLVDIRITGTGMAYRSGLNEHVWRDPSIYLNSNFLQRINGLPVIRDHPKDSLLTDDEFKERILGTVMLPYIKNDEVWAIVRIYNSEIIDEILEGTVSTSPAVSLDPQDDILIGDKNSHLLIEGKPALVDHIALVTKEYGSLGVWDKNNIPEGIEISNKKGNEMDKEELQAMLNTFASSIGSKFDELNNRFDSVESKVSAFDIRLDSVKKDNHIEEDKEKEKEVSKELKELKNRSDAEEKESMHKEIAELRNKLDEKCKNQEMKKDELSEKKPEDKKSEDKKDEDKKHPERNDSAGKEEFSFTAEDKCDNAMIDARV